MQKPWEGMRNLKLQPILNLSQGRLRRAEIGLQFYPLRLRQLLYDQFLYKLFSQQL